MKALYTETFVTFLENVKDGQVGENPTWTAFKTKLAKFPDFTLEDIDFDFYELFKDKYEIREIGAETESLFMHNLNDRANELIIKYVPKIQLVLDQWDSLVDRKVTLSDTGDTSNYLYPVSSTSGKVASKVSYSGSKDSMLYIFKSNAEVLNQVLNLKDIYLDALQEFENCFMGIY